MQNGLICNPSELQNGQKLRFLVKKHIFSLKKVCFLGRISNCEHESSWYQRNPLCHIKLCKIHKIYTPPELKKALKLPKNAVFSKKNVYFNFEGNPTWPNFSKMKIKQNFNLFLRDKKNQVIIFSLTTFFYFLKIICIFILRHFL